MSFFENSIFNFFLKTKKHQKITCDESAVKTKIQKTTCYQLIFSIFQKKI
jgi:hypothetical protein